MKIFTGRVIAKTNEKTARVSVERVIQHPLYGKRLKRSKTYQVHDEVGVNVGDVVKFVASRPISKSKRWKIFAEKVKKPRVKKTK